MTAAVWALVVAAVGGIAAPLYSRYWLERKRITFRVEYRSKVGLSPDDLDDESVADRHLRPIAELLDRMAIVVLHIRNSGVAGVEARDFGNEKFTFSFPGWVIWDARISEPSVEEHRGDLTRSLRFSAGAQEPHADTADLDEVRDRLKGRMQTWFEDEEVDDADRDEVATPKWDIVGFDKFDLQRGENFRLVIVLRPPDNNDVQKVAFSSTGRLVNGKIVEERRPRLVTWWRPICATVGVLATIAAIVVPLLPPSAPPPGEWCGSGSARIVGSSAFAPIVTDIARSYTRSCRDAHIDVEPNGSIEGVAEVAQAPESQRSKLAALSDGESSVKQPDLIHVPLAVVVYGVVVNDAAGVDDLTPGQVRGIIEGRYRNWNELRPGPSVPIRIVGRGHESGSRRTFEQKVLGESEGPFTSDSCDRKEAPGASKVIRCERSSEDQVVKEVASTEGAIGYVDVPAANEARSKGLPLDMVKLGGNYPDSSSIPNGYDFWTIEYLYSKGYPEPDSALKGLGDYLSTGTARDELQSAGYLLCIRRDGRPEKLCQ